MVVNEIFGSIDGEGLRTGELATFIRLAGCNLRCSYCDTLYALNSNDGKQMTIEEIISEVEKYKNKNITITGGEPLIHDQIDDLIDELISRDYRINIETNGAVDIKKYVNRCLITMDYKTPSSLMENQMILDNLEKLTEGDVLKFVVNEKDLPTVKEILSKYKIKSYVYISPIFNEIELPNIVEYMKLMNSEGINMDKVRMQVQLHKIIWSPDMKGV
ncbi:MAG: radical SAM protein [Clostridia bacterium]|nr:radical SAM protein [Clostridia bacterium]